MIYKIFREAEYTDFIIDGKTQGSADDIRDGFIHFSTAPQLAGTLAEHFSDEDDLFLLMVNPAELANLKWEQSRNGQDFPHLYDVLKRENVLEVFELHGHQLPKGLA